MKRIEDLELLYVKEVLDSGFRSSKGSVYNNKLEKAVCETYESDFAIGHVNATAAMHTALLAFDVKRGDEIIVPPLSMSSTAISVLQANGTPIFADINPETLTIDPDAILKCITNKTVGIMAVALYGLMPNLQKIKKICKEHSLFLIEDNADCLKSSLDGNLCGSFGDFSCYSYQASKHLTCGNGGMLTTNSEYLANKARKIANLGYTTFGAKKHNITKDEVQSPDFDRHECLGFNYRLSEINAAVVLAQIERHEDLLRPRIYSAQYFENALKNSKLVRSQVNPDGFFNSYWCFTLILKTSNRIEQWKEFRKIFLENGGDPFYAACKLSYNEPLFYNNSNISWQKYEPGLCPVAEKLQPNLIQLKTNYWNEHTAKAQAEILKKSIKIYEKNYVE